MNENKYLEKVANALKDHLTAKGVDTAGMSSSALQSSLPTSKPGSFGSMNQVANKLGSGPKTPGASIASKVTRATGVHVPGSEMKPLSQGAKKIKEALDASGQSLQSKLQESAANKASGAGKGFLEKAIGLAKKNPLVTAGAVGVGALGVGKMLGSRSQAQPQFQQYQGY